MIPRHPRRVRFFPHTGVVASQSTTRVPAATGEHLPGETRNETPQQQRVRHAPQAGDVVHTLPLPVMRSSPLAAGPTSHLVAVPPQPPAPAPISSVFRPVELVAPQEIQKREEYRRPVIRTDAWKPGTFGFDNDAHIPEPAVQERATIITMVVDGLVNKQDQPKIKMQSDVSGTAGAAGIVGLGSIIGSILKYGTNFMIQYGFGPGLYGLYTLSLSLVNLFSSILNLGLDDAMVRYVAIYRGKKESGPMKGLILFCTALAGLAGLAGATALLIFTPRLVGFWTLLRPNQAINNKDTLTRLIPLLQVMAPLIPLLCMQIIWFAGLRGFKAFKLRVLATNVAQPALQLLLLFGVLLFYRNIIGVALALLISTVFSVTIALNFIFRQLRKVATPEPGKYRLREWLTFATLNFLTTILDTVLDSIDTLLLASFSVPRVQLGLYGAAIRLSVFISLPLTSLANVFAPTIAELHSRGERGRLETMFKVVTKWSITFSLPIFLVLVLFSPYILSLSGRDFVAAWPLVIAFALGNLINAGTGTVGYMLLMTGYNKLSFLNSLVAVVVNIVLGIILTPRYGAMGTAIATGLALGTLNIMRLIQVRLLLKMQPYRLDTLKPFGAGFISAALVGAGLYLLDKMNWHALLGHAVVSAQLALIPVFLASYTWLLILFKGSPEDQIVIDSLRKKFLGKKIINKN